MSSLGRKSHEFFTKVLILCSLSCWPLVSQSSDKNKLQRGEVARLAQRLQNEPLNAGIRVDLIILLCSQGQRAEAETVFADLRSMGAIPERINQLVSYVLYERCAIDSGEPDQEESIFINTSFGLATNVNAAPEAPGIFLGEGGNLGYFTFDPESRPKNSGYTDLGLTLRKTLFSNSSTRMDRPELRFSISARDYQALPEYNTNFFDAQLVVPTGLRGGTKFRVTHWRLGGQDFETTGGISYERQVDLGHEAALPKAVGVSLEKLVVTKNRRFDTYRLTPHIGAMGSYSWILPSDARVSWAWSLKAIYEKSIKNRPGGDRLGLNFRASLSSKNSFGSSSFQASLGRFEDQRPYNEELFGAVKRERSLVELAIQQRFQTGSWGVPYLEVSWSRSKDRIPLFAVESAQVKLGVIIIPQ